MEQPFHVWKHNYLDVTSSYPLNHGDINPKNRQLDSFNHHVTAGWVAVSDRSRGILIAEDASKTSNLAFAPMRLRTRQGRQRVRINPFGSYHGSQFDTSHMGGNPLGSQLTLLIGAQFNPNAPSYNGRSLRFSLLIAPYLGDEPPEELQEHASVFFYPYGVRYDKTPLEEAVAVPEQMTEWIERRRRHTLCARPGRDVPVPDALTAETGEGSVSLNWSVYDDPCITGFEIFYKKEQEDRWKIERAAPCRMHTIEGLDNDESYLFRVRTLSGERKGIPHASHLRFPPRCEPDRVRRKTCPCGNGTTRPCRIAGATGKRRRQACERSAGAVLRRHGPVQEAGRPVGATQGRSRRLGRGRVPGVQPWERLGSLQ